MVKTSESSFDPFGVVLRGAGQINIYQNRFEFLNREKESTFNLNFIRLGARGYTPTIGRFDRIDPKADEGLQISFSPYTYGFNNPIRYSDPDGLMGEDCCGSQGGILLAEAKSQWEAAKSYGRSLLQKAENGLANALSYTDVNDATVLVTIVTRSGNAVNIDGSKATTADKWAAAGGVVLPLASGSAAKQIVGTATDKVKDVLKIDVTDANKINRELLNPPTKHGNAPTFKKDGTSVEIHHEGQKREGPFKEMHQEDHRMGENYRKNHPEGQKPLTKEERKEFNNAKKEYWKSEYPK